MLLREDRAGWPYSVWLLMFPAATLVLILAAITQATATATVVAAENDSGAPEQARVFQKNLDPCGIVHITIGDGGNREGLARIFMDPKPEWSLYREASFGHGQFQVINATHAHWTWHRNEDDEPIVADEVWLNSHIDPLTHCIA
eukprot:c20022_g1_i1 orf=341-772(-)